MVTAHRLKESASYLEGARALLRATDPQALAEKIRSRSRKFPWLVAVPLNTLAGTFTNPGIPRSFTVVGADGSSIQRDRHSPIRFYVINTGHAILTYGPHPGAELDSSASLYFEDHDLFIDPEVVGTGLMQFNGPASWLAAGATGTPALGNLPTAAAGTFNGWLTVKDDTGTTVYIPSFV